MTMKRTAIGLKDSSIEQHLAKQVGGAGLRWLGVTGVALLAAGCTMIPKYERPASPVPGQYPGYSASTAVRYDWVGVPLKFG